MVEWQDKSGSLLYLDNQVTSKTLDGLFTTIGGPGQLIRRKWPRAVPIG